MYNELLDHELDVPERKKGKGFESEDSLSDKTKTPNR